MSLPVLRFKDETGQDFPEWEVQELGQIANKVNIKNKELLVKHVLTNSATQGIVSQSDYFDRDIANKNNLDGYYVVELDDFVYNPRISVTAPVGPIKRNKAVQGVMSPLYTVFRFNKGNLDYLEHYFETTRWHDHLKSVANSGARHDRMNITSSDFLSLPLVLPHEQEQTKIANFLTAVDEKIHLLNQKHELLTQYKKGVMQQIFSQELRFKDDDGGDFPEWEELQLGDVAEIIMGQSPDSKSYNDIGEGVPLIQGNADITNRQTSPRAWTTAPTKKSLINDIILTVRAPVGSVAVSKHVACIGRGVCAIRNNEKSISDYIYQLLLWYEPTKWVSLEQGSTFTAVSGKDIKTIDIPLPTLKEQTKIAIFLTAIDDKITQTQAELDAVKQYKQGLLQQMFV